MSADYAAAWADFQAEYGTDTDEAVFQAGWIMRGIADSRGGSRLVSHTDAWEERRR